MDLLLLVKVYAAYCLYTWVSFCCHAFYFNFFILRTNKQNDSPLEVSRSVIHPFKRVELTQWGKCYRKLMYMMIKSVSAVMHILSKKSLVCEFVFVPMGITLRPVLNQC